MDGKDSHIYDKCKDIKRLAPDIRATEEAAKEIGSNYRTIPTFEKGLYDHVYKNYYSLEKNELLKCRWKKYKEHIEEKNFSPFQFPSIRDLHFYNGCIRFLPALSIHRIPEFKMKLKPGPGVDFRGQIPIPQELLVTRQNLKPQNNLKKLKLKETKMK